MSHDLFAFVAEAAARDRAAVALVTADGQRLTYGGLEDTVEAFAAHASKGISAGEVVCIEVPNAAVTLCIAFALSRLGAVPVLGSSAEDAAAGGVRVDAVISARVRAGLSPRTLMFHQGWMTWPEGYEPGTLGLRGHHLSEPLIVMSSSGSTGFRKFMAYSATNFRARLPSYDDFLGAYTPRMIAVSLTSVIGFSAALRTLARGGCVAEPDVNDAATLRRIRSERVAELIAAPLTIHGLVRTLERAPVELDCLEQVSVAGSSVSSALVQRARRSLCDNVMIAYGTSEAGFVARTVADAADIEGGVGEIAPWATVDTIDGNGNRLPEGESGLLRIRVAPGYAVKGYLGADEPEGSDLASGCFTPGDLGRVLPDGTLVVAGRSGDVINIGGNKVSARIIEAVVLEIDGVSSAAAVARHGEAGYDELLVAYCGTPSGGSNAIRRAVSKAAGTDAEFRVHRLDALPLTPTSKIDRQALVRILDADS